MKKIKVGILGATGMVGQRFITILDNHPWFEVICLAASPQSKGKKYSNAVEGRWKMEKEIPLAIKNIKLLAVEEDMTEIAETVQLVFCALDLEKEKIKKIEEQYAGAGVVVVSNNSANRGVDDIPMIMPEVNPDHLKVIPIQQKSRGWKKGFIVVKPNCSIQSYVSILSSVKQFRPLRVNVTSIQALSGAGKTFATWPEMVDNAIPFIGGEEKKSEEEPLKIWGKIVNHKIVAVKDPKISATCIRIPVANGHMASISVKFAKKPSYGEFLSCILKFNPLKKLNLPSAPKQFITYFEEDNRPQTKLDRDSGNGMGITMGRLRKDTLFDYKFIALSHNTIRGAAGGAVLVAELLRAKGYI